MKHALIVAFVACTLAGCARDRSTTADRVTELQRVWQDSPPFSGNKNESGGPIGPLVDCIRTDQQADLDSLIEATTSAPGFVDGSDQFYLDLHYALLLVALNSSDRADTRLLLEHLQTDVFGADTIELLVVWNPVSADTLQPINDPVGQLELLLQAYLSTESPRAREACFRAIRRGFWSTPVPHMEDERAYVEACLQWMTSNQDGLQFNLAYEREIDIGRETPDSPILIPR